MAFIELDHQKLHHNFKYLDEFFSKRNIHWGAVSKLLCGNETYIRELIEMGIREVHDSRISNLKVIKKINPEVQTVYIKPPARRVVKSLVRYADVSFNTEYETIRLISEEAVKQNKKHKIIIMIEMGDLREGVLGDNLIDFYSSIFKLPNIEIVGIGTNLNCLNGVMPSHDKLIQLSLYKQLIDATFKVKIPWVSGGSSVTIPLLLKKMLPKGINHFRVGETLYFGNNLVTNKTIKGMKSNAFTLYAEIVELMEKPIVPIGELGTNVAGEKFEVNEADYGKSSYRALLDIGLLDVDPHHLKPIKNGIEIIGASSDMLAVDLGKNRSGYQVGDLLAFNLDYMGALKVLNSNYIDKRITNKPTKTKSGLLPAEDGYNVLNF
ncbi:MAG: alanine/ornithine racemase family PLP-dependent enzyme [Bacteroidales bacterium]|jgi:predicted amino acid racemase|nr:alanine/ornithine racemase family PLP-dependent enzyme [Bacteroidales bacterium]HOI31468.1 alanine/ornithine racemase family PLP-dependent enzyme [Bacteroidales bacterium]